MSDQEPGAEVVIETPSLANLGDQSPGGKAEAHAEPELKAQVAALEAALSEKERQVQRLAADFENFRRRAANEKEELSSFAAGRVLEGLLPIVDNFERALSHAKAAEGGSFLQGVDLIYRQIMELLGRQGVTEMDSVGQAFDPNLHEAIGKVSTADYPDNAIVAVIQKGYFLNNRVLRHAMVQVADNPQGPAAPPKENPVPAATDSDLNSNAQDTLTLEGLMSDAQVSQGAKEESYHG